MESQTIESVDMYGFEIERFQELLEADRTYAFQRYGCTLLYSLPPNKLFEMKKELGWKTTTPLDYYNAGTILCEQGDLKAGLKEFEKALKGGCDRPELFFNMAIVYEEQDDKKSAKEYFQKYIDAVEQWETIPTSVQEELDEAREHIKEL